MAAIDNDWLEPLKAEPRFQNMVSRLEQNEGET